MPWLPSSRSKAMVVSRCWGSSPLSGSSRISTFGSCTSACAILTRCRMPCEKPLTSRSETSSRSTVFRARRAASCGPDTPRRRAQETTSPSAVRPGHSPSPSGTSPIAARAAPLRRGSSPSTRIDPSSGRARPVARRIAVDLPAPLWPSRPVTPGSIAKETSPTATVSRNHFETRSNSSSGVMRRSGGSAAPGCRHRRRSRAHSSGSVTRRQVSQPVGAARFR